VSRVGGDFVVKVKVYYTTQLKQALGCNCEEIDVGAPATIRQLLDQLSQSHGEAFDELVLAKQGNLSPSMLVCVGNEFTGRDVSMRLNDGDEVTFLSPVSGG